MTERFYTTEYRNGFKLTTMVEKPHLTLLTPSDLEEHEAEHAVVAIRTGTGIKRARVKGSSDGSEGAVEPNWSDPIAAATSHNRRGRWHDEAVVRASGMNPSSAIAAAKEYKSQNKKEILAVATLLHFKGDVSGHEVEDAMDHVNEPQKNKVVFQLVRPEGTELMQEDTVEEGEKIMFPGKWVELSTKPVEEVKDYPIAA